MGSHAAGTYPNLLSDTYGLTAGKNGRVVLAPVHALVTVMIAGTVTAPSCHVAADGATGTVYDGTHLTVEKVD